MPVCGGQRGCCSCLPRVGFVSWWTNRRLGANSCCCCYCCGSAFVVAVVNGLVVSKGEFMVFQIHKVVDTEFAGVGRILVVLRYPAQVAFKDMLAVLVFFARIIDPTKLFHKPFKGTILQRRHVFCQRSNHGTKKEGCQQQQEKAYSTTTTTAASDLHDDVSKRTSFGELVIIGE